MCLELREREREGDVVMIGRVVRAVRRIECRSSGNEKLKLLWRYLYAQILVLIN